VYRLDDSDILNPVLAATSHEDTRISTCCPRSCGRPLPFRKYADYPCMLWSRSSRSSRTIASHLAGVQWMRSLINLQ